jgi:hypothetical protein
MGKSGMAYGICTVMDGPYHLPWQVLLSYDTPAAAVRKLANDYNLTSSLKPDTVGGVITL